MKGARNLSKERNEISHFSCELLHLVAHLNGAVQTINAHLGKVIEVPIDVVPKSTRQLEVQATSAALLTVHRRPQTKISSSLRLMPLQNTSAELLRNGKRQLFILQIIHKSSNSQIFQLQFWALQRQTSSCLKGVFLPRRSPFRCRSSSIASRQP